MERTTSFNPEATAFNPLPQDTSSTSRQDANFPLAIAPMFNRKLSSGTNTCFVTDRSTTDSPFRDAGNARSFYAYPDIQEIRALLAATPTETPPGKSRVDAKPTLPPFTFPEPVVAPQNAQTPVDINELSAGLGLPWAKAETSEDTSTVVSHESQSPQAHPGALYGKLIGWALEKPLTAKGLAEFLQKQDVSTPLQAQLPVSITPSRTAIRGKKETALTKSESPSRRKTVENVQSSPRDTKTPPSHRIVIPSPPETIIRAKGRDATSHLPPRRNSSAIPHYQHTRVPSHRYPRRPSRAKRSDQGPMPSAADIYPDDAHWTPSAPLYEAAQDSNYRNHSHQPPSQPQIIVANPFNWPPPAQVYAPELPPTPTDISAADTDILELIDQLPSPSLCTLAKLGNARDLRATTTFGLESAGLDGDERALTPGQEDGSRYGIRFWGIGYGDQWELPGAGKMRERVFGAKAIGMRLGEGGIKCAVVEQWEH